MANLNKLLLAGGFPPGNNSLNHFEKLFAQKVGDSGIITTATGNPVSIVTNRAQNAISTLLSYSPKQSGSGDPSPTNIRPIEGWTEANLFGCGKNLAYKKINGGLSNVGTVIINSSTSIAIARVKKSVSYAISADGDFEDFYYCFFESEPQMGSESYNTYRYNGNSFTAPIDGYVGFRIQRASEEYQCEVGSQATDYAPFITPTTITANLGGTYYGFSIDLERGVLRATDYGVDLGDFDYTEAQVSSVKKAYYFSKNDLPLEIKDIAGAHELIPAISDSFTAVAQSASVWPIGSFTLTKSGGILPLRVIGFIVASDFVSDASEFKNWAVGKKMVYELATPIELPLTPQTVALLAGNNTLWTDGDSLSVTYKAKK